MATAHEISSDMLNFRKIKNSLPFTWGSSLRLSKNTLVLEARTLSRPTASPASLSLQHEQGNHSSDPKAGATCIEWLQQCPLCPCPLLEIPLPNAIHFTTQLNPTLSLQGYHGALGCTLRRSEEHCPRKASSPWAGGAQAKSKLRPSVPDVRLKDTGGVRADNTVVCQQLLRAYQAVQELACLLAVSLRGGQHRLHAQKMHNNCREVRQRLNIRRESKGLSV